MVKLSDVAREAGVSIASVSLVLSGQSVGRVSAETAARIRRVAAELKYVRNDVAGALSARHNRTIGFVSYDVASTPYAFRMVSAAVTRCRENDHVLVLVEAGDGIDDAFTTLASRQIDKVAIASMYHRRLELPADLDPHVIAINGYVTRPGVISLVPDEIQGMRDAVSYLIAMGHRRIGYLSDNADTDAAPLRLLGYRLALKAAGISPDEDLIRAVDTDKIPAVDAAITDLLDARARPTAIACFNDRSAMGVYRVAARLKLAIPDDISVIGFDDFHLLDHNVDPQLTSVRLPHEEMARCGVDLLLADERTRRTAEKQAERGPIRFRCPLVERGSVVHR